MVNRREFLLSSGVALASSMTDNACASSMADLELILALDHSGSEFEGSVPHWGTQMRGHLYALHQEEIRKSLLGVQTYVRIVTWSDTSTPVHILFEGIMNSPSKYEEALVVLQGNITHSCVVPFCAGTDHFWLVQQISEMKRMGYRRVLDVSTDQVPTDEAQPFLEFARERFEKQDGTINALAVKMSPQAEAQLRTSLCTSNGVCFSAGKDSEYAEALKRKIITEIA